MVSFDARTFEHVSCLFEKVKANEVLWCRCGVVVVSRQWRGVLEAWLAGENNVCFYGGNNYTRQEIVFSRYLVVGKMICALVWLLHLLLLLSWECRDDI